MNLYFQDRYGKERFIDTVNDKNEIIVLINDFLQEHSFISYYTNIYYVSDENRTYFDVGSWSEKFFVDGEVIYR